MVESFTCIQHVFTTVARYVDQNASANDAFFTQRSNARLGQGADSGISAVPIPDLVVVPNVAERVVLS
ncbi:hypothetical protein D3C81_1591550 [compost metagenome]